MSRVYCIVKDFDGQLISLTMDSEIPAEEAEGIIRALGETLLQIREEDAHD